MPIARFVHETVRVTIFALIGFALLRYLAAKTNVPALKSALGMSVGA